MGAGGEMKRGSRWVRLEGGNGVFITRWKWVLYSAAVTLIDTNSTIATILSLLLPIDTNDIARIDT